LHVQLWPSIVNVSIILDLMIFQPKCK